MFCTLYTDCTECETCIDGFCRNPCKTDNLCPENVLCDVVNHRPVCLDSSTEQSMSNCSVLPGKDFFCRKFRNCGVILCLLSPKFFTSFLQCVTILSNPDENWEQPILETLLTESVISRNDSSM